MATLICPAHGPQPPGGKFCPVCQEFLIPEPAAPVCPEPGCGNLLDPDGTCPLHHLGMAAEAAAYAGPEPAAAATTREANGPALFQLDFPFGPVAVGGGEVRIGRAEELGSLAVSLSGYDKVSRQHAIVWVENGDLFVRDLGSTNGTFVNDHKVEQGDRRRLHDGDEVRFSSVLRVRVRRAAAA